MKGRIGRVPERDQLMPTYEPLTIRRDAFLPQGFRNDAEHRTAVEALAAGLQGVDAQAAELAGFMEGSRSGHRVRMHDRSA